MTMFSHLAPYYDDLFPLNQKVLQFFKTEVEKRETQSALDVACGTGQYTLAFGSWGLYAAGIDIDRRMIAEARKKQQQSNISNVSFVAGDMRNLNRHFSPTGSVFCIGNSLAALTSVEDVQKTLQEMNEILLPGGFIVIQLVNFDRYLAEGTLLFPVIEREDPPLRLERKYAPTDNGLILFTTHLSLFNPQNNRMPKKYIDRTKLIPIDSDSMTAWLKEAGFSEIQLYGDFDRSPWTSDSPAAVYQAVKSL